MNATALIAEDEPLLAQALQAELARAWPELKVLATVGDGAAAGGNGFGLAQIRERLRTLHGEGARFDFDRDAGGAHARISLPIA